MKRVYEVELNRKGAPDFSTAKECVRCRDCIEYAEILPGTDRICMKLGMYHGDIRPEDYCSRGVRRD